MYNYSNRACTVDTYEEEKNESKTIDITIGVFFDGTGNNKYNVYFNQRAKEQFKKGYEAYIDKKGQKKYKPSKGYDSYKSGYSNVAILWEMYDTSIPYQEKVYIEGPGTKAPVGGVATSLMKRDLRLQERMMLSFGEKVWESLIRALVQK